MSKDRIGVVVRLAVHQGQEDEFKAIATETMVEPTQSVPGCLKYEMWQDKDEPWRFVIVEEWESEEAHGAHLVSEWLQPVMGSLAPYASEQFEMQRLTLAGSPVPS